MNILTNLWFVFCYKLVFAAYFLHNEPLTRVYRTRNALCSLLCAIFICHLAHLEMCRQIINIRSHSRYSNICEGRSAPSLRCLT